MVERLALGTVQFGVDYGINNPAGRMPQEQVGAVLADAEKSGIRLLDTAYAYGESECILGAYPKLSDFKVVSKLAPSQSPEKALEETLWRLQCENLYGYLLHDFSATRSGDLSAYKAMRKAVECGIVEKGGFSVYYPEDLEIALSEGLEFELVQIPYSVFDRRFDPVLGALKEADVEIHARSVFLQGLFFLTEEQLIGNLKIAAPSLRALKQVAERHEVPLAELCLRAVLSVPEIDHVVIGVNGIGDLRNNVQICKANESLPDEILHELKVVSITDESILLPFNWERG